MSKRQAISRKTRFAVLAAGGFRCRYCGKRPHQAYLEVDHIVPVARGGSNHPRNLAPACRDCNGGKSDSPLSEVIWRPLTGEARGRCRDASHPGPWTEVPYGPPDKPGSEVALVCSSCNFIVAVREWVA